MIDHSSNCFRFSLFDAQMKTISFHTLTAIDVVLVRKLSQDAYFKNSKGSELRGRHIHICSENNFPTAAGLASSAAGYSCLGISHFS